MEDQAVYAKGERGYDPRCITKLVRNFRSHPALLEVPAQLYYDNELVPCADKVRNKRFINLICIVWNPLFKASSYKHHPNILFHSNFPSR